ncbi:uracil phosphoribosyltransferase-domain-containing protein [Lentinula detonsa]|uniref:Uracil phosphoribosyltransferase-domain-containing protein n=1 Tax=Lentinula detonsa TaxID=2804962 RepID=A0A9W8U0N4_9AGAR|nr:uracil phosphoribosyltransferase-domain-containing protein [Lentinula detonsa]
MTSQVDSKNLSNENSAFSELTLSETIPYIVPVDQKPIVVGLYGVPGCGKTVLLNELEKELGEEFAYFEGAAVIARLVPGGLDAFQKMEEHEKMRWRELAINDIQQKCALTGRVAVVVGHFMFWDEKDEAGRSVWTGSDQKIFTHILYLDIPAQVVALRRHMDSSRIRPAISEEHIRKWQRAEREQLRILCLEHRILFSAIPPNKVAMHLRYFREHTEDHNVSRAEHTLDEAFREVSGGQEKQETTLVFDGDRTLIPDDTGILFWKLFLADKSTLGDTEHDSDPLKELFSSPFGYSYAAFCQAALIYEAVQEERFSKYCEMVASSVTMFPEIISLLKRAENRPVGAVVVTCGLRLIWEKILQKAGLSKTVKVIGGGPIRDGLIVTDKVKATLVARLRDFHRTYVCVFGDSILDLPMLKGANQAVVVVGEKRSRLMESALLNAIENEGLRAWQVLLPKTASIAPRLDKGKLPVIDITKDDILNVIVFYCRPRVLHPNENTAKVLMTPMRDARVSGPALQQVHRRVGQYLATEFLPDLIGLEEYSIQHVQGTRTSGHRLLHEDKTLIIALMRGGEPMAFGVNEALPSANFLHAKIPQDVESRYLQGQETLILVDSVINNGKTVEEFVLHIRKLHSTIRILVVVGVIQAQSLNPDSALARISRDVDFIALRLSDNKFTGKGTTDTGNRLFNTTHLQ